MLLREFTEMRVRVRAFENLPGSLTNDDSNQAELYVETPASKKLKLLADIDVDQTPGSQTADSSNDHDQHQFFLETSAYLGPIKLTNEEKLSPLSFWKRHSGTYPRLSQLARIYLTPNASSVPVESLFSITGMIKNARRASLAPFKLNKLTFVHDNYSKFNPIK
jgi:hAT family C-terminal dimerisation region